MCGRYALTTPADVLARVFEATVDEELAEQPPRYNLAPTQPAPVVRARREGSGRTVSLLRFGLVPYWSNGPDASLRTINARSESAAGSRVFGGALRRRRCLVPADGFFEWKKLDRGKQPYFIHLAAGGPMAFAGVWERWRAHGSGEVIDSFAVLTTEANQEVRPLHDRMPVILEPADFDLWLDRAVEDPETLGHLLRPAAAGVLAMYPVSTRVNAPANDDAAVLQPLEPQSAEGRQPPAGTSQLGLFEPEQK
jgi:putative SOS response-associated peptidase YedK